MHVFVGGSCMRHDCLHVFCQFVPCMDFRYKHEAKLFSSLSYFSLYYFTFMNMD